MLDALPGVLCTLNYDNLIETATKRRAITWKDANKTQEVLQGKITDAVLHLHGWFDEPESVVLDMRSYLTVKDDPHAKAVSIASLSNTRSCSLAAVTLCSIRISPVSSIGEKRRSRTSSRADYSALPHFGDR